MSGLTPSQLESFKSNGYLVITDELDAETVSELLGETHRMLDEFSLEDHPMTRFTTGEGDKQHVGDRYFLDSGGKVRFFFEEDAFDPQTNRLTRSKSASINKIGHCLHSLQPAFRRTTLSPRNRALARSLGFRDPRVLQSMIICKQPEIGAEVPPHQDSTFLYTDPPSAVGFWYALEDAAAGNGALGLARGSQMRCGVGRRFVRMGGEEGGEVRTGFVENDGGRFPEGVEGVGEDEEERNEEEKYEVEEVKAGSLVIIHGNVLHKSGRNTSGKSRFVYTFHVIEGENEYDDRNWLRPPEGGFSKLS